MKTDVPPVTFPVACELEIVEPAILAPTSPPAALKLQEPGLHGLPLPTVTVTLALDPVIVPATLGPRFPFWPTSPPAMTPTRLRPLTVPVAVTLLTVPAFEPATTPTHCELMLELKPGFALT